MPADCRSVEVDATPEACFSAMTDFEALPAWQGALKRSRIVEQDPERGTLVEFTVDAKVKEVTYRLWQRPDPPHRLGCEYAGGDLRDVSGEWRFLPLDDGRRTKVELELSVDPGRFVPGPVRRIVSDAVMQRSLDDLRDRFAS